MYQKFSSKHLAVNISKMVLQYFVGGSPYNIMVLFGVSHSEVFNSIQMVVDATNIKNFKYVILTEKQNRKK